MDKHLHRRFYVNNVYNSRSNGLVVFLGYQDGPLSKTHGFFRHVNDSNTFFGLKLTEIIFIYP